MEASPCCRDRHCELKRPSCGCEARVKFHLEIALWGASLCHVAKNRNTQSSQYSETAHAITSSLGRWESLPLSSLAQCVLVQTLEAVAAKDVPLQRHALRRGDLRQVHRLDVVQGGEEAGHRGLESGWTVPLSRVLVHTPFIYPLDKLTPKAC